MNASLGQFPFGQSVQILEQQDRTPKKLFVLGVYASAVHARWLSKKGTVKVTALAVASEPYIFWRGDQAESIIGGISIPSELGRLEPADCKFNGPSGVALDERFLGPLGLERSQAWLCDLVPHSCVNSAQQKAIDRRYTPRLDEFGLNAATVPPLPKPLTNSSRRETILNEIEECHPSVIMLLGDEPIRWFLDYFVDKRWGSLSKLGKDVYGRLHRVMLKNKPYDILPLVHPRQAAGLGTHSPEWYDLHETWRKSLETQMLMRNL